MNLPPMNAKKPVAGDMAACTSCWTPGVAQLRIDKHRVFYFVCHACSHKDFTKTQTNVAAPFVLEIVLNSEIGPILRQMLTKYTMEMMVLSTGTTITQKQAETAPSAIYVPKTMIHEMRHAG